MRKITKVSHVFLWFLKRKKNILLSVANVVLLMFLTYVWNNQPLFTGESLLQYSWVEYIKGALGIKQMHATDDAVFVNVGYDKKLVERTDEFGLPLGNISITDRRSLTEFLRKLNASDMYQFIFLDVIFEKGYEDIETDSLFIAELKKTKRVVIATHPDVILMDNSLEQVAALNNYYATIVSTNFTRYQYSSGERPSMPLFVYNRQMGYSIDKTGPFYFCNGKLCYNSIFVRFPYLGIDEYNANGEKQFYNLGSDILSYYSDDDLSELCKGKYVFIGDMIEDLHDTYSGVKAGPTITYYAFKELQEGMHFVNYLLALFLAVIFFFISISLLKRNSWYDHIPWVTLQKSKTFRFLMAFVSYTFILTLSSIVLGLFFDRYISILLPSLYFSLQKLIIDYKRM